MSSDESSPKDNENVTGVDVLCRALLLYAHGHDGRVSDNHAVGDSSLEKVVTQGHVKVTAILPPVRSGTPVVLTVRIASDSSGQALSDAKIYLVVKGHDDDQGSSEGGEQIQLNKTREAGVYTTMYEASHIGMYTFAFSVTERGIGTVNPPIVVETTRNVLEGHHEHNGKMNGEGGMDTYIVI